MMEQFKVNEYNRVLDKKDIPVCNIMGVNIAAINMDWLIKYTTKHIKELSGDYMCVSNVHTTVTASENPEYCRIQNEGIMAIPDGGPLSSVGRKRGYDMSRTTGPSYMEELFSRAKENKFRHYFYGSSEETLSKLELELKKKYPDLIIAGMYSPPFRELTDEEDENVIEMINECSPDFVWVGLGAPKQEIWMNRHQGKINGFMVGVGAGFDYFAGNINRAPEWMQRLNLEWLYRLLQDPKRMWKRYITTNPKFICHAVIRKE